MWLIPPNLQPPLFIVLVVVGTWLIRRHCGWPWLIVFWLGSTLFVTGLYVSWVYYISPLSLPETNRYALSLALALFSVFMVLFGVEVWLVAIVVRPRTEPEYFPRMAPPSRLEDRHGLSGVPWCYDDLLDLYDKVRKQADEARKQIVGYPPYRIYSPSYIRQNIEVFFRLWRTPHVIFRDFVTAEPVLRELGGMTAARLSALKTYHRLNLQRVKGRRKSYRWLWSAFAIVLSVGISVGIFALKTLSALIGLLAVLEKRGAAASLPLEAMWALILRWGDALSSLTLQWGAVWTSMLAFVAQPANWVFIGLPIGAVLGLIANRITTRRRVRRLEAFGDLLTMAVAHRRLERTIFQASE